MTENMSSLTCAEFVEKLGSSAAVPGGGGASALVSSIGVALGNMVSSLTVGKIKYKDVEEEMKTLGRKAGELQNELLTLITEDAKGFEPLSKAYGLPRNTEEEKKRRDKAMEEGLEKACIVPLEIMEKTCEAIVLTEKFAAKGSRIAVSDAGVSACALKAGLEGASLNIYINTAMMKNREKAVEIEKKADSMISEYGKRADAVFDSVKNHLREG